MQRFDRRLMGALALAVALPVVGACSSDTLSSINPLPKSADLMRPDWLSYSGNKEEFTLRPAGPADLVGPDGQCAEPAAAAEPAGEPGVGGPALVQGGIALQMTECDVVRRAGAPERVDMGANERGERSVVLTYARGPRAGIYRFASGRLVSIERGAEPAAPARPQKAAPAKKRA
jgi:hypothetical protein